MEPPQLSFLLASFSERRSHSSRCGPLGLRRAAQNAALQRCSAAAEPLPAPHHTGAAAFCSRLDFDAPCCFVAPPQEGVHPQLIIKAYRQAAQLAVAKVKDMAVR